MRFVVVLGGSKKKKERRFWHVSRLGGHGEIGNVVEACDCDCGLLAKECCMSLHAV